MYEMQIDKTEVSHILKLFSELRIVLSEMPREDGSSLFLRFDGDDDKINNVKIYTRRPITRIN